MARTHSKTSHHTPTQQMPDTPARNAAASHRNSPSHEQIAKRAYEIFLSRGGTHGRHHEDWAQAERELKLGR